MAATSAPTDDSPGLTGPLITAIAAGAVAGGVVLWAIDSLPVAAGFFAAAVLIALAVTLLRRPATAADDAVESAAVDWSLANMLASICSDAIAVTDRAGRLVCANERFGTLFPGYPAPPAVVIGDWAASQLGSAGRAAWRDGEASSGSFDAAGTKLTAHVTRVGDSMLIWRFAGADAVDLTKQAQALVAGKSGDRLGQAGIMMALIGADGRVRAANRVLRLRAAGDEMAMIEGRDITRFLITDNRGTVRFEREGLSGTPIRVLEIPFLDGDATPMLVALLDEEYAPAQEMGEESTAHVRSLIALLPTGIALVGADGRFAYMNDAFVRAAHVNTDAPPLYPGDLVVREDKSILADAVRRFAAGAAHSMDLTVRFAPAAEEAVSLSIASARGLGDAAVLLSLRDAGEEGQLKRQVAQATKMQAVGQLAGGVAHDFNNILTAIIGHCDLMLMRHAPGDSDYDDIQQILLNSNRAAALTRQLLAFSRQQTLRPQVLQLPDIISEVSNLLKRLLGETVELVVNHGRNLGPVRADPGQLEQVVVNLAVNARDAMLAKNPNGGGTLTIETLSVAAREVRAMDDDVLPVGDYTALRISDTGSGIPADVLAHIWEPFFTTKEVGKGTGLGLSTVYGIIKQSGGFIFAESAPDKGAVFTIYLPVHNAPEPAAQLNAPKPVQGDLWGSGTILLVEDEAMVRAVAERALARQGYTVLTAENGEAALELLEKSGKPDLLISDVVMPTMDGPTMVRHARKKYPDLKIIFMSGYAEEQLRKSIDIDKVAFLPKPFSVQQLAELARSVMTAK
ncbi:MULTISPECIES: response regulator [unclassified Sphingomonas]|uniref:hybrid sensor histidine kinase/response regulator n=1 Tax=unclassified Sphingomonas TaxID=196159 RepID=UPI002150FF3E|nr:MULTISPECIES: response regulator [unclassified Sphingomonas]MCR5872330.1 response regulator [Sphingomonas sp. J344]UUX99376.1 response regulator [Sphingomonas sp. J315]